MAFTSWNPSDKSANISLSGSNLIATAVAGGDIGVRAVDVKTSGKWYFELKMTTVTGGDTGGGLANATAGLGTIGNVAANALIEFKGGNTYYNGTVQFNLGGMAANDVVCVAYDAGNHRAWIRHNGGSWNNNAGADPATNTLGIDVSAIDGSGLYPVYCSGANADSVTADFGDTAFAQTVPSGFIGWQVSTEISASAVLGITEAVTTTLEADLAASVGIGLSEAATLDFVVLMAASAAIGITEAAVVVIELDLAASAGLGLSEAAALITALTHHQPVIIITT